MFGGLVVPCSILVSIGMPEKYAVYLVLAGMIPFEYAAYCILRSRRAVSVASDELAGALQRILSRENLWLDARIAGQQLAETQLLLLIRQNLAPPGERTSGAPELWSRLQSGGLKVLDLQFSRMVEPSGDRAPIQQLPLRGGFEFSACPIGTASI